jgi:hypothetical protein
MNLGRASRELKLELGQPGWTWVRCVWVSLGCVRRVGARWVVVWWWDGNRAVKSVRVGMMGSCGVVRSSTAGRLAVLENRPRAGQFGDELLQDLGGYDWLNGSISCFPAAVDGALLLTGWKQEN